MWQKLRVVGAVAVAALAVAALTLSGGPAAAQGEQGPGDLPLEQDPPEVELDIPAGPLTTPFAVQGRVVDASGVDPEDLIILVRAGQGQVLHFWEGDPPDDSGRPTFSFAGDGTFDFVVDLSGVGGVSGNMIQIDVGAADLHGNSVRQSWDVELAEAFDVVPPVIDITFPKRYRLSDHVVRIAGTAQDDLPIMGGFAVVTYSGFGGTLELPLDTDGDRWEVVFDPRLWRGWVWTQHDEFTAEIWIEDSQRNAGIETLSFKVPRVEAYCLGYGVTVDLGNGERPTDGNDIILGTSGDDTINAGRGDDVVCAGDGNDRIRGDFGDDLILGEGGRDRIWSGPGNDAVAGGTGRDRIRAGRGSDLVVGEGGRDTIWGGPGDDELFGGGGNDRLDGGSGANALQGGTGVDSCRSARSALGCES